MSIHTYKIVSILFQTILETLSEQLAFEQSGVKKKGLNTRYISENKNNKKVRKNTEEKKK